MASPAPPSADAADATPPGAEGGGLLERIGAQLASLTAQVSEMDQRMTSVESGAPPVPVEVELSPEAVAQVADALAALLATGSQALDDAFKSASDDLTDALSGLVRAEVSRSLADAGYMVVVTEAETSAADGIEAGIAVAPEAPAAAADAVGTGIAAAPSVADTQVPAAAPPAAAVSAYEPLVEAPVAAPQPAAMPSIAAPLAASSVAAEAGVAGVDHEEADEAEAEPEYADAEERPPLTLTELDDPFLDALVRKEPLSA